MIASRSQVLKSFIFMPLVLSKRFKFTRMFTTWKSETEDNDFQKDNKEERFGSYGKYKQYNKNGYGTNEKTPYYQDQLMQKMKYEREQNKDFSPFGSTGKDGQGSKDK